MTKQFYRKQPLNVCLALLISGFLAVFALSGCKGGSRTSTEDELARAKKLISQGNYTAAFMELNQALSEAPKDPNVHLNLGWLYLYTDDEANAEKELGIARALAPELAETYHLQGSLYSYKAQKAKTPEEAKREQEAAVESFRQSLSRDDKNYQAYFDLAGSLAALDKQDEVLETLDKGFEYIPPKDLETQVNFEIASCAANAKLQQFEDAIADCQQALRFTASPASRERIEEMIENMKLMNPALRTLTPEEAPPADSKAAKEAEEQALINESSSD